MLVHNSNADSGTTQASSWPRELTVTALDLRHNPICPNATTSVYEEHCSGFLHVFATTCKRWGCAYCSRKKIQQLAIWTAAAAPNRLLTLTIDPAFDLSPKAAWLRTAHQVPELIRKLRLKFGPVEYLRVTELHKSGYPHYHLLVRSGYLPHQVVKDVWSTLTGATIVDLRAVEKAFSAYWYLTKYLSKMKRKTWTERHVSFSRKFVPAEVKQKPPKMNLLLQYRSDDHPYRWLADHRWHLVVTMESPHHFRTENVQQEAPCDLTNWELGIPAEPRRSAPQQQEMVTDED